MSNEFVNRRNIQWFPGHMAKTLRLIEANLKTWMWCSSCWTPASP